MTKDSSVQEEWFQRIWRLREEEIYPRLFGDVGREIHTIKPELFKSLGSQNVDPRWLTHGVLCSPPGPGRESWLYISSGLSNPWGVDPDLVKADEFSGLGFEFLMQTQQRAPWAIEVLNWLMAMQILIAVGEVQGQLLEVFDRVPLGKSIDGGRSLLRNLLITESEDIPPRLQMESGVVDFLLCVGITDAELQFARAQGGPGLLKLLKHHEFFPITGPNRVSTV
ncbi:MAG TPA: suppressor of fused domain protein [Phycisphaerae bacterium]|nr:suppressor of fused domain protein [Phycisphaerae bacterium]